MIVYPQGYFSARLTLRIENPAAGADTILAESLRGPGQEVFFLFTLPSTANYYVHLDRQIGSGNYTAYLRKTTVTSPSVAIDHRDIVAVSSPDGVNGWSPKVRVNDDGGFTDQSMPALVVDDSGGLHVSWYDRRFDARCRARADVVLASSWDGGASFSSNLRLTTASSSWQLLADAVPNFGNGMFMAAEGGRVYAPWSDGRLGSPDVMVTALCLGFDVETPDSVWARRNETLQVPIQVHNVSAQPLDFTVQVQSSCVEFPDTTFALGPVAPGDSATGWYQVLVGDWFTQQTICPLQVVVTSAPGCSHESVVDAIFEPTIAVVLQDLEMEGGAGLVRLAWRATPGTLFDVERGGSARGPFERLTAQPIAARRGDCFEFVDAGLAAGTYHYRLAAHERDGTCSFHGPYRVDARPVGRLVLHGAHPNPFNPSTLVRFELPHAGRVDLRILDVRGCRVATLLHEALRTAGSHAVAWDGRDEAGVAQPSGVYIAELRAGGEHRAARLVLVR
jgi:hypothetical protein